MEWIIAIVAVVAAMTSAAGTLYSANAQKKAAEYNEEINKRNAATSIQQAQYDAEQSRLKGRRLLSAQRAAYSASGVDPDSGSPLDVQEDSAITTEEERLVALYTGRSAANASLARARLDKMEAKAAMTSGYISAGGTLLGGTASGLSYANNPRFGSNTKKP